MLNFRKSKWGFTLIELMVVVAIIGVLALLGLRLYTTQQEKAKNALVKANAGTIQTLIQGELADADADAVFLLWTGGTLVIASGIRNPITNEIQANSPISTAAIAGEVWVDHVATTNSLTINGLEVDGVGNVYGDVHLTASR